MAGFQHRFVGLVELPRSLSQLDIDESFRLSQADVDELRGSFKSGLLGAALQLVVVRATGRTVDKVSSVPRLLLRSMCKTLGVNETAIASLRSLYKRPATRFAHREWARDRSGLVPADEAGLVTFQRKHVIAELWDKGDKASADMMSLDASRHLYSARLEPRRRTAAMGIYTHVMGSYGVFYDQPIVLNERQAGAAVHGVEAYNAQGAEGIRLSLLAVDTHGYTNVAMALAKLLGFDLCVRLQNVAERKLFLPRAVALPAALERVSSGPVSVRAIGRGWDELLRVVASIRSGKLSTKDALEKLGSAAAGDPMHKAAGELGKLLRTIFLCDYFANPAFRREIHTLLNCGESVHQMQRAIYHGRIAAERGRRRDEMRVISGSHALLTNVVIAWNTMKMQAVVDRWRRERHPVEDAWLRCMGPVHFGHINFQGTMALKIEEFRDALLQSAASDRKARSG